MGHFLLNCPVKTAPKIVVVHKGKAVEPDEAGAACKTYAAACASGVSDMLGDGLEQSGSPACSSAQAAVAATPDPHTDVSRQAKPDKDQGPDGKHERVSSTETYTIAEEAKPVFANRERAVLTGSMMNKYEARLFGDNQYARIISQTPVTVRYPRQVLTTGDKSKSLDADCRPLLNRNIKEDQRDYTCIHVRMRVLNPWFSTFRIAWLVWGLYRIIEMLYQFAKTRMLEEYNFLRVTRALYLSFDDCFLPCKTRYIPHIADCVLMQYDVEARTEAACQTVLQKMLCQSAFPLNEKHFEQVLRCTEHVIRAKLAYRWGFWLAAQHNGHALHCAADAFWRLVTRLRKYLYRLFLQVLLQIRLSLEHVLIVEQLTLRACTLYNLLVRLVLTGSTVILSSVGYFIDSLERCLLLITRCYDFCRSLLMTSAGLISNLSPQRLVLRIGSVIRRTMRHVGNNYVMPIHLTLVTGLRNGSRAAYQAMQRLNPIPSIRIYGGLILGMIGSRLGVDRFFTLLRALYFLISSLIMRIILRLLLRLVIRLIVLCLMLLPTLICRFLLWLAAWAVLLTSISLLVPMALVLDLLVPHGGDYFYRLLRRTYDSLSTYLFINV
jgi:hypothetical protein